MSVERDDDRVPTQEEIAVCAYQLWQEAGCPHGQDREHWQQAEEILRGTSAASERYDVVLLPVDDDPLPVVNAIRQATGLDLTTIKAIVAEAPRPIRADLDRDRAAALCATLGEAGVPVELVAAPD